MSDTISMARTAWGTIVTLAVAGFLLGCGGGDDAADPPGADGAGTRTVLTETERTVQRTARRYVRAMREADVAVQCGLTTASERRRPGGICDLSEVGALGGPTPKVGVPEVTGTIAEVRIERGEEDPLVLGLLLEDGDWAVSTATFDRGG